MSSAAVSPLPHSGIAGDELPDAMLRIDRLDDGVVVLRLAHGQQNALDVELLEEIIVAFAKVSDASAVVLTGEARPFPPGSICAAYSGARQPRSSTSSTCSLRPC